jgi:hypothetical protein
MFRSGGLKHETTCASEILEKTTCEKFCQKGPPTSGGTPGQATRGTCRLDQWRQAPAADAKPGMWPSDVVVHGRLARVGPAAYMEAGMLSWLRRLRRQRQHLTVFK